MSEIFIDVVTAALPDSTASDGVLTFGCGEWAARAAYELALHTYDVMRGLSVEWTLPDDLCAAIMASPSLWMFDRDSVMADDLWASLFIGSGRPPPR